MEGYDRGGKVAILALARRCTGIVKRIYIREVCSVASQAARVP